MTDPAEITERERETSTLPPPLPQSVVWQLLRTVARDREHADQTLRRQAYELRKPFEKLADDVGMALHKLREFVRFSGPELAAAGLVGEVDLLRAIADRFSAALDRAGVEIIDPVGRPYPEVCELVDVVHVESAENPERLVVTGTVQAGLLLAGGELLRRARVQLGAAKPPLAG